MRVVQEIPIAKIKIGKRLREDLGDLTKLAESIRQRGLLHPVVIDDKKTLIAGQRRLEAVKLLGKKVVEVRLLGDLSEHERLDLELEENSLRKNLTAYERSKVTVRRAEIAERIEEKELCADSAQKPKRKRGRPKSASRRAAAERLDVPEATIRLAEEHVTAAEKYPFLQDKRWNQKAATEMGKLLDEIGEEDTQYLLGFCSNGTGGSPQTIRNLFETWRAADARSRKKLRRRLDGPDPAKTKRAISLMAQVAPNADERLVWSMGLVRQTKQRLKSCEKGDQLKEPLERLLKVHERFQALAQKHNDRLIEEERRELFS